MVSKILARGGWFSTLGIFCRLGGHRKGVADVFLSPPLTLTLCASTLAGLLASNRVPSTSWLCMEIYEA